MKGVMVLDITGNGINSGLIAGNQGAFGFLLLLGIQGNGQPFMGFGVKK